MTDESSNLVAKLWSYCNILRDDGMSYGDYVEQLTYLLFLKMADEHSKPPFLHLEPLPHLYSWSSLVTRRDEEQLEHYERILRRLSERRDLFGSIYMNALSKFRDPGKFGRLVTELSSIEWSKYDSDLKGDAYESLLEKTATDGKAGAGQYFTPRPLVDAIVKLIKPRVGETICDPACGTGGFLLAAHREVSRGKISKSALQRLNEESISGVELVESVARLCLMNLVLHGIGGRISPITIGDSLETPPTHLFDIVLANPPFGKRGSVTFVGEKRDAPKDVLSYRRKDFWATTSNKQLNFLQHIFATIKPTGRAAVIVPDNVLFEGGAGEIIRRNLLMQADVHTLLRLPTGIFYAQGVKANVLFFDRFPGPSKTRKRLWIYDLRTNSHFTLKEKRLQPTDLADFIQCYHPENRKMRSETLRFKPFDVEDLLKRDKADLDIFWLDEYSMQAEGSLPQPDIIAAQILEELQAAIDQISLIASDLQSR